MIVYNTNKKTSIPIFNQHNLPISKNQPSNASKQQPFGFPNALINTASPTRQLVIYWTNKKQDIAVFFPWGSLENRRVKTVARYASTLKSQVHKKRWSWSNYHWDIGTSQWSHHPKARVWTQWNHPIKQQYSSQNQRKPDPTAKGKSQWP